jgi:uncharacterized protein with von Willebrand factor type A (vWA) domain
VIDTVHLDLPGLAGVFGQRLREAGVPVTPERSAAFARALVLVRPISRRRLYFTARSVFVSEQSHARAFDAVFNSVFGGPVPDERAQPDDAATAPAPPDERPASAPGRAGGSGRAASPSPSGDGEPDGAEVDVPLAMASDEEVLAGKSFEALDPRELAQLYRLMSRLELGTPLRRTRRYERGRHGQRIDMRRTLRGSMRSGGDPIHLERRRRRVVPRRLVMLCDISGSMEPYGRAYLQFLACAAGSGPHAEAFAFATRLTRLTSARPGRRPTGRAARGSAKR